MVCLLLTRLERLIISIFFSLLVQSLFHFYHHFHHTIHCSFFGNPNIHPIFSCTGCCLFSNTNCRYNGKIPLSHCLHKSPYGRCTCKCYIVNLLLFYPIPNRFHPFQIHTRNRTVNWHFLAEKSPVHQIILKFFVCQFRTE